MQTIVGHTTAVILSVLEKTTAPISGAGIAREYKEHTKQKLSPGSAYPLLTRLKTRKCITAKKKGRSIEFTITAKGKKTLQQYRDWASAV